MRILAVLFLAVCSLGPHPQVQHPQPPTNLRATVSSSTSPLYPLRIRTSYLPQATVGYLYIGSIEGSGGFPPYTCRVVAGAMPSGVVLDPNSCQMIGRVTGGLPASFTIQMQDLSKAGVQKGMTVTPFVSLY